MTHVPAVFPSRPGWTKTPVAISLFPSHVETGDAWLYVIGLRGSIIKIGQTKNPRARMSQHYALWRDRIVWMHVSGRVPKPLAKVVERRALQLCKEVGAVPARKNAIEELTRLSPRAAIECVRQALREIVWAPEDIPLLPAPAQAVQAGG